MTDTIGSTTTTAATAGSTSTRERTGLNALADQDTFLKLLISQVQNQDPLNPQEPVEFVSQLAQFSQLETLLSMRKSLELIEQSLTGPEAAEPPVDGGQILDAGAP
jgi:flagellar basal-body rod modification protein FlgD